MEREVRADRNTAALGLDAFAAAALTGLIARGDCDDPKALAKQSFQIARYMVGERVSTTLARMRSLASDPVDRESA